MPGALSPYTVLEMGDHPSAAVLGMLLADQGANVIKIEPTTGDPIRGTPVFSVWNRGKQSVTADPGAEDGVERVKALLAGADVVIESFYSGANPFDIDRSSQRTIHVTLPGFGPDHPDHDVRGSELVVSSATGVYVDRSPDSTEGASFIALPYASVFAAMVAAPAIAAALFHRERTGEVQNVVVPIYNSMFTAMGSTIVSRPDIPAGPAPLSPAIGRFYRCADGRWINLNASYERSLRPLLEAMGHPEWYGPLTDDRLRQNVEEREEWAARFREPWLERTALEWESLMAEAGVPLTMCRTLQEWMETEHARESGAVVEIDDPTYGPMRQVGIQVKLSDTPGGPPSPAPALGQHNNTFRSSTISPRGGSLSTPSLGQRGG